MNLSGGYFQEFWICILKGKVQVLGRVVKGFVGVPVSQYIDDRHGGQLFIATVWMTEDPSFQRAQVAAYSVCYLLVEAGYFIGLDKSQSTPSTCVRFLSSVCDSVRQVCNVKGGYSPIPSL